MEKALSKVKDPREIPHDVKRHIRVRAEGLARIILQAGKEWVQQFVPPRHEKRAATLDWDVKDDIIRITEDLDTIPARYIEEAFHEAAVAGGGAAQFVDELAKEYQIDRARDIGRTVFMNIYAKAALREMLRNGFTQARRMEFRDHKVCFRCIVLNNKIYEIEDIVNLPDPLTRESHPRCRGSFVPVVNSLIADISKRQEPMTYTKDLISKNKQTLTGVPVEYAPHLGYFASKQAIPFSVEFDPNLDVDSRLTWDSLKIHPRALYDQDPREIILENWARSVWSRYRSKFEKEYVLLTQMGLAKPSRTVKTLEEYWVSEFTSFKLGQMDTPFELLWFKTNVKE